MSRASIAEKARDRSKKPAPEVEDAQPEETADPPLHGKTDPPSEMDEATPTLDDSVRNYHHHPSDAGAVEFGFDPLAGDAAADLAGDLGSQFLEGATRGEDLGAVVLEAEDREESAAELLLDEPSSEEPSSDEPSTEEPSAEPTPPVRPNRPKRPRPPARANRARKR